MQIIVFGASGTTGKEITRQALALNYHVRAFVRDARRLSELEHEKLEIVTGDVLNADHVAAAIKGVDAVVCALGAGRKGIVRAQGTKNIIEGMRRNNVERLICQSTLGAGDSRQNLNFFWKRIMFGWFLKEAYNDHQLQEQFVERSGLEWTIVHPAALVKGDKTGKYYHGFSPAFKKITSKISIADTAEFMISQITSSEYLYRRPGLSY